MREKGWLLGSLAAGAAAAVGAEIYRETHCFVTTRYRIGTDRLPADLPELRIVFLSDLHNKEYGAGNGKLFDAVCRERPDLILIGGDMLVGKRGLSCEGTVGFLEHLASVAPVWYANGNHEQRIHERPQRYGGDFEAFKERLERSGVRFLLNRSEVVDWHGQRIRLTGLEPPCQCYDKWVRYPLQVEEIEERVGRPEPDAYEILLAHTPEYAKEYLRWGADLVLAGHFHGGIIRLPFLGAVIGPQFLPFPKYSGGHYREEAGDIVVSKGLGTHTVNLRFLNPAELVTLHVRGTRENERDREEEKGHGDSR